MRRRTTLIVVLLALLAGAGLGYFVATFSISALENPGSIETYLATRAKHWLVTRSAHGTVVAPLPRTATDVANGQSRFSGCCGAAASCCGMGARGGGTAPG
jgi:hypothetical protein